MNDFILQKLYLDFERCHQKKYAFVLILNCRSNGVLPRIQYFHKINLLHKIVLPQVWEIYTEKK